jgi:hypothetical protein
MNPKADGGRNSYTVIFPIAWFITFNPTHRAGGQP